MADDRVPEPDGAEGTEFSRTEEPTELARTGQPAGEPPELIRDRAVALVEYLLAVRALIEKPARTVPATDAYWQVDLPGHPACQLGPHELDQPSWLRVGRPRPPDPPRIPTGLLRHLIWDLSPSSVPTLVEDPAQELPEPVRADFRQWYEQQWRPWSAEAVAAEATRALHDRLYHLRYRLDIEAARVELVWGHLVLDAPVAGQARAAGSGDAQRVHYPLVTTPVAIGYDPETTTVTVTPTGPPRLQPDALAGLDERRVADLLELGGTGGQLGLDPWDPAARTELAGRALRRLGLDPVIRGAAEPAPAGPHVHDTGVLFVRPRQRMVRRFLARMRERLLATGPESVGGLASILAHEPSRLAMPGDTAASGRSAAEPAVKRAARDTAESWQRTADRLLMPLATNDAQESIARRLAAHRSVAVQGPPGTGKTHTIRNLICHLVAHGRRVLVLAQKEDPLRVLRDGLPAEIQPLCLAILGRSADQLVQLQVAARELSDRAATLDQPAESERVDQLREQLAEAEVRLAEGQAALRAAAERESATYQLDGFGGYPGGGAPSENGFGGYPGGGAPRENGAPVPAAVLAEWLRRHEPADGFVPDPVPPGVDPPLAAAELAELAELARRIAPADRAAAAGPLPAGDALPSGEEVAAGRAALRDARKVVAALRDRGLAMDAVRELGVERMDELAAGLRGAADQLARREGSWTDRLGQLVRDPNWQQVWDHHVAACQRLLAELARRTAFAAGREVQVPEPHAGQPRRLLGELAALRERYAAGRRVGRLSGAGLARLAAGCVVDGEPLRTAADVDLVVATVERGQLRRQLAHRWSEWGERLGLPAPEGDPELWAGRLLTEAADALDWERKRWPELHATLARIYPGCPRTVDARTAGELAGAVEAAGNLFLADRIEAEHRAVTGYLRELASDPAASPVIADLLAAWPDPEATGAPDLSGPGHPGADLAGWDAAVAEAGRLRGLRAGAVRYAELRDRLATVAPQWADEVDSGRVLPASGEAGLRAWRWRQAQSWFDQVVGAVDPAALGREVERWRERARRLTGELVVASAWLEVARILDDRRKAALADWTAALRKLGKGTGKSAPHWQAVAQQAMDEAVGAVPVWVMSIDRALEQFRGGEPRFDVVIVDEASQADIFSLPVLSLARRAVVVGDDQQIGPQLVGAPTGRVNALITSHLAAASVPSAVHFDPESSLYDHAVRRSPQRILLTEHFRCVPPIIGFSSATYYDRKIQPLRADRPAGLGAPITAVPVPAGHRAVLPDYGQVNLPEAEALVARAAAIVADPAYQGKTLGVVSLLSGSGQAAYLLHRLQAELGADELERRALRVGHPYTFQGDERDVVLISMVVASADGEIGAFTKRDFHRRVNVAASRARDQLWLFHSVAAGDLPADDARALLLGYCHRPPATPVGAECETDLERAVLRRLAGRGLDPAVQYPIGEYRIDFLLEAPDGRRLAVECDGDGYRGPDAFAAALRRQAVLERVGDCVFVRLRASRFHRDPDAAMQPVWDRAAELGIPVAEPGAVSP